MIHESKDLAAAYALGALDSLDSFAFEEHLGAGCDACRAEVESFEESLFGLAINAGEMEPPAYVRNELLLRTGRPESWSLRSSDGEWREVMPGVMVKRLHLDRRSGIATSLVRMNSGTSLPRHRHHGTEQFLVLEGDCHVNNERLGPGDFHIAEAGSIHDSTYTRGGTMFLLIADQDYHFSEI